MGPVGRKAADELVGGDGVTQDEHRAHLVAPVLGEEDAGRAVALDAKGSLLHDFDALVARHVVALPKEVEHVAAHLGEVERLAPGLLAVADDCHGLSLVEMAVAGGAVAHAASEQLLFARPRFAHDDAAGKHHAAGLVYVMRALQGEVVAHGVDGHDLLGRHRHAHRVEVGAHVRCQLRPADVGQTRVVAYVVCLAHLGAQLGASKKRDLLVAQLGRHGGRYARRSRADNRDVHSVHACLLAVSAWCSQPSICPAAPVLAPACDRPPCKTRNLMFPS